MFDLNMSYDTDACAIENFFRGLLLRLERFSTSRFS